MRAMPSERSTAGLARRPRRGLSLGILVLLAWIPAASPAAASGDGSAEEFLRSVADMPPLTREHTLALAGESRVIEKLASDPGYFRRHSGELEALSLDVQNAVRHFQSRPEVIAALTRNPDLTFRVGRYYRHNPEAARSAVRQLEHNPQKVRAILGESRRVSRFRDHARANPALAREEAKLLKHHPQWRDDAWNSEGRTRFVLEHSGEFPEYSRTLNSHADEHPGDVESAWRDAFRSRKAAVRAPERPAAGGQENTVARPREESSRRSRDDRDDPRQKPEGVHRKRRVERRPVKDSGRRVRKREATRPSREKEPDNFH